MNKNMRKELEEIANEILNNSHLKPNYSNRDFMNAMIIFQSAIMCEMFELQNNENIDFEDRLKMAYKCGIEIHNLIKIYTGLDTHKVEEFSQSLKKIKMEQRKLAFRAWDNVKKEMNYKVLVGNTDIDDENYTCNLIWDNEKKEWVNADHICIDLMQFTGLIDRNGNEKKEWVFKHFEVIGNMYSNPELLAPIK